MTHGPITDKRHMYALLAGGAFGNTVPQYFDLGEWERSEDFARHPVWGVRTLTAGGPCRLYCQREEVRRTAEAFQVMGHRINVSLMIDACADVTLMAEAWEGPGGLTVHGIESPQKGADWRRVMPGLGRTYTGTAARMLLRRRLNPNSLADLCELLDLYPGHVVEFSACGRCIGTVPGRNAVVWEVRPIEGGTYERLSWGYWR